MASTQDHQPSGSRADRALDAARQGSEHTSWQGDEEFDDTDEPLIQLQPLSTGVQRPRKARVLGAISKASRSAASAAGINLPAHLAVALLFDSYPGILIDASGLESLGFGRVRDLKDELKEPISNVEVLRSQPTSGERWRGSSVLQAHMVFALPEAILFMAERRSGSCFYKLYQLGKHDTQLRARLFTALDRVIGFCQAAVERPGPQQARQLIDGGGEISVAEMETLGSTRTVTAAQTDAAEHLVLRRMENAITKLSRMLIEQWARAEEALLAGSDAAPLPSLEQFASWLRGDAELLWLTQLMARVFGGAAPAMDSGLLLQDVRALTYMRDIISQAHAWRDKGAKCGQRVLGVYMRLKGSGRRAIQRLSRAGLSALTATVRRFWSALAKGNMASIWGDLAEADTAICWEDNFVRLYSVRVQSRKVGLYHNNQSCSVACKLNVPHGAGSNRMRLVKDANGRIINPTCQVDLLSDTEVAAAVARAAEFDELVASSGGTGYFRWQSSFSRNTTTINLSDRAAQCDETYEFESVRQLHAADGLRLLRGITLLPIPTSSRQHISKCRQYLIEGLKARSTHSYTVLVGDIGLHLPNRLDNGDAAILSLLDCFHTELTLYDAAADVYHTPVFEPLMRHVFDRKAAKNVYKASRLDQTSMLLSLVTASYPVFREQLGRAYMQAAQEFQQLQHQQPQQPQQQQSQQEQQEQQQAHQQEQQQAADGDAANLAQCKFYSLRAIVDLVEFFVPLIRDYHYLLQRAAELAGTELPGRFQEIGGIFDQLVSDIWPKLSIVAEHWGRQSYGRIISAELATLERMKQETPGLHDIYRTSFPFFSQRGVEMMHRSLSTAVQGSNLKFEFPVVKERVEAFGPLKQIEAYTASEFGLLGAGAGAPQSRPDVAKKYDIEVAAAADFFSKRIQRIQAATWGCAYAVRSGVLTSTRIFHCVADEPPVSVRHHVPTMCKELMQKSLDNWPSATFAKLAAEEEKEQKRAEKRRQRAQQQQQQQGEQLQGQQGQQEDVQQAEGGLGVDVLWGTDAGQAAQVLEQVRQQEPVERRARGAAVAARAQLPRPGKNAWYGRLLGIDAEVIVDENDAAAMAEAAAAGVALPAEEAEEA